MLKIEVNEAVAEIEADGSMENIIPEAMVAIRTMYDFFKDHDEDHGEAFKELLQMHAKDDGAILPMNTRAKTLKAWKKMSLFKKNPPAVPANTNERNTLCTFIIAGKLRNDQKIYIKNP